MAKAPTNATTKAPAKVGAAPAKKPDTATTTDAPKPNDKPADGDAAEAERLKQEAEAKAKADGDQANKESVDVESIKEAAYKEGYSNGFSAALDELAEEQGNNEPGEGEGPQPGDDVVYSSSNDGYIRERLIALALYTPENQRKGGLFVVVDRLQKFVDDLPPEDRDAAVHFMDAIAKTSPIDLASGRFRNVVTEALDAIDGGRKNPLADEDPSQRSEAALDRLNAAAPDLDGEQPTDETVDLGDVDIDDPDSPAAAAARLAGV